MVTKSKKSGLGIPASAEQPNEAEEILLSERIGAVTRLTLNRPNKLNALSGELRAAVLREVDRAERDANVRAIIIRGAGRSFCSGNDVGVYNPNLDLGTPAEDVANIHEISAGWDRIWHCRVPVVAQVHGYCVAGGTDLALNCDMIVVANDAKLGFPPVRSQGSPPTHMWTYLVGPQWAKRLLLTGDVISGAQAAELGLALQSVPAADLDDVVLRLALRMTNIGKDLLAHNKRMVNLAIELMGRGVLQSMAGVHDALAHLSPESIAFRDQARISGFRTVQKARDANFEIDEDSPS